MFESRIWFYNVDRDKLKTVDLNKWVNCASSD